jgi:ribose transport system ATP-binding protein
MSDGRNALVLSRVSKRFGTVQAVADVSVDCRVGEIHAVVGENGSGKSTLLSMAAGLMRPDDGHVEVGGERLHGEASHQARHAGLAMVFQTRSLASDLTVAENVHASVSQSGTTVGYRDRDRWVGEQVASYGLDLDVRARVGDLSLGQQQMLEIVKALMLKPKVLLLDEPTTALDPPQIDSLHSLITALVADGGSVLYVSHRLEEILSVAQRVTVMRDGTSQGTYSCDEVTEQDLIALMVAEGSSTEAGRPRDATGTGAAAPGEREKREPVLSLRKLTTLGLGPIDLDVWPGEIVGVAGADSNGQTELFAAVAGLRPAGGSVVVGGDDRQRRGPKASLRAGIMLLPGDRLGESMVPALGIRANATVNSLDRFQRGGLLTPRRERDAVSGVMARLQVRTPSLDQPVRLLSGGNQQKVVLARPFLRGVRVLLADEPTQGVDVNSRAQIYAALREKTEEGVAVLVKSSDPLELAALCDRVVVMSRGRIVRELVGDQISEHSIVGAFVGSMSPDADSEVAKGEADDAGLRPSRPPRGPAWLSSAVPFGLLALLTVGLCAYTASRSSTFFSSYYLSSLLLSALPLSLVALAQTKVLLVGGFDISVGLTATLGLVVSSFVVSSPGTVPLVLGIALVLSIGVVIGLFNGLLVTRLSLPPIVVTIATLSLIQGLCLIMRPVPGGSISQDLVDLLSQQVSFVPVAFLVVVLAAILADLRVRRSRRGLEARFTGFDENSARRIGIRTRRVRLLGYVMAAVLASVGGLFLAPQVGVGDPSVGAEYALASVAAAVLGGASLSGGRGSYIGAVWAAVFLSLVANVSPLLGWNASVSLTTSGALTLAALSLYSWGLPAVQKVLSGVSRLATPGRNATVSAGSPSA